MMWFHFSTNKHADATLGMAKLTSHVSGRYPGDSLHNKNVVTPYGGDPSDPATSEQPHILTHIEYICITPAADSPNNYALSTALPEVAGISTIEIRFGRKDAHVEHPYSALPPT